MATSKQSLFPGRQKGPGLKSPNKLWWAKEVTPDIHIAGRLTSRQIKYAEEGGFRSIISLFSYNSDGSFGYDILPSTPTIEDVISYTNLKFKTILNPDEEWVCEDAVNKFETIIPSLPKPALFFSNTGFEATLVLLLYLAKESRNNPNTEDKMDSDRVYAIAAAMGMDFTEDRYKKLVSNITGHQIVQDPPLPDADPKTWIQYWLVHPVLKNWFTAGQITRSQYQVVHAAEISTVVNIRSSLVFNGKNNQEEVTLLNIAENTGTYGKDGVKLLRQTKERLESTRIDQAKSNCYISKDSEINYELKNLEDFGDDIGYNRDTEQKYVLELFPDINYYTLPVVSSDPFTKEVYMKYRDTLLEAGGKGPVIVHCAKARRASFVTILAAAEQHNKDINWALTKSQDLGYAVSEDKNPVVYKTFKAVLDPDSLK